VIKQFVYKIYSKPKVANLGRLINLHGMLYNHCIALHKRYYKLTGKHLNQFELMQHIAKLKDRKGFEWIGLMGSQSVQDVIKRIEKGYALFFSENKKAKAIGKKSRIRPPTFRKIDKYRSFTLTQAGWKLVQDNILCVDGRTYKFALSCPIEGKMAQPLKRAARPRRATFKTVTPKVPLGIKRDAVGDFWVAFACEVEAKTPIAKTGQTAGIDFGLKTFLAFSDGSEVESPQFFRQGSKEIAKANRKVSRSVKGSGNRKKAVKALARVHRDITRRREDWQWKEARKIVERFDIVWIEDLNLRGMKALWGRKVSDLAFYSFTLKLDYLLKSNEKQFGKRDRFLASSKTHFDCGYVNHDLKLSDRVWICNQCGELVQRDHNAALMIEHGRAMSCPPSVGGGVEIV